MGVLSILTSIAATPSFSRRSKPLSLPSSSPSETRLCGLSPDSTVLLSGGGPRSQRSMATCYLPITPPVSCANGHLSQLSCRTCAERPLVCNGFLITPDGLFKYGLQCPKCGTLSL